MKTRQLTCEKTPASRKCSNAPELGAEGLWRQRHSTCVSCAQVHKNSLLKMSSSGLLVDLKEAAKDQN
jgi:hypothetical protein